MIGLRTYVLVNMRRQQILECSNDYYALANKRNEGARELAIFLNTDLEGAYRDYTVDGNGLP